MYKVLLCVDYGFTNYKGKFKSFQLCDAALMSDEEAQRFIERNPSLEFKVIELNGDDLARLPFDLDMYDEHYYDVV